MASLIACPGCNNQLSLPDDFVGQRVQCPRCSVEFEAQKSAAPPLELEQRAPSPTTSPPIPSNSDEIPYARPAAPAQTGYVPAKETLGKAPSIAKTFTYCLACGAKMPRDEAECPACGAYPDDPLEDVRREPRLPRGRHLPPYSGILGVIATVLVPMGVIFGILGPAVSDGFHRGGSPSWVLGICLTVTGGGIVLIALVLFMMWMYQAWRLVARDDAEYSPGLMVGLLFVPVFNFYWMFRAIPGLSWAVQYELRYLAPNRSHGSGFGPGLSACILLLIPYLQPIAICMFLAWVLLVNNALNRLVRYNADLIRREEQADEMES